jgi:hypothetical protein
MDEIETTEHPANDVIVVIIYVRLVSTNITVFRFRFSFVCFHVLNDWFCCRIIPQLKIGLVDLQLARVARRWANEVSSWPWFKASWNVSSPAFPVWLGTISPS